eukprot:4459335-Lingulodinium_polyedra.AAC.1
MCIRDSSCAVPRRGSKNSPGTLAAAAGSRSSSSAQRLHARPVASRPVPPANAATRKARLPGR